MIISPEEQAAFLEAENCYLCNKPLHGDRVRDHCHMTGAYRGPAHNRCNLQHQNRSGGDAKFLNIPVVFHNLKGYDANHIMCAIGRYAAALKLTCIPQTVEKYVTFSLGNLRFIDSLNFLNASLETLVKNLGRTTDAEDKFPHMGRHFPIPEEASLLRRKGVYPYAYMSDASKLEETSLPPKEAFYNDLREEACSDEDYAHAQHVWETFALEDMGEYHDLYLKTDVLLLADVFENFRELCVRTYKLDPAHYVSAPSLAWDAMLKHTGVHLDLLTNADMHLFVEEGLRGGVSMIARRWARANNPRIDPELAADDPNNTYIVYWDANNLYGWAMSQFLPQSDFAWV